MVLVLLALSLLHWASLHSQSFDAWHVKKAVGLPRALFSALTFHLNWLEAKTGYLPPNWDVMWSLSVEEMFYLFFPLVCIAFVGERSSLRRIGWPLLFLLAGSLLVLGPWARSVWIASDIGREKSYLGGMNAIAMGCLAALLCDKLSRSTAIRRGWLHAVEVVRLGADCVGRDLAAVGVAAWREPVSGADRSGRYRVAARSLPGDGGDGSARVSWRRMADGTSSLVWTTRL